MCLLKDINTARRGQTGQDSQHRKARTRQPEHDSHYGTSKMGQAEQDRRNRKGRTRQTGQDRIGPTGQDGKAERFDIQRDLGGSLLCLEPECKVNISASSTRSPQP
jgi:hypothetical protein